MNKLDNLKAAGSLITSLGLPISSFPHVYENMLRQTVRYYLFSHFRKRPDQDGFMDLDQIEDLFMGKNELKALLVDELVLQGKIYEAKIVMARNQGLDIREDTM